MKQYFYSIYRVLYLIIMYTGIRGVANRIIAKSYGDLPADLAKLHKTTIDVENIGLCRCYIYHRQKLLNKDCFMISLQMLNAPINNIPYKFFCITSHFARGHIEGAFHFANGKAVFYAFRNIARSNAMRLCMKNVAERLRVEKGNEMHRLAQIFFTTLDYAGLEVELEAPDKILELSIDKRLLKNKNSQKVYKTVQKRYDKMFKTFSYSCNSKNKL